MPHKENRKPNMPTGAATDLWAIDHASGQQKPKRNMPRPDQSSNIYTQRPSPGVSSSKGGKKTNSRSTPSDDDADGDVSNVDAAEPDDESDEDGEGDAFAPSDRAIEEHGDQAGLSTQDLFDGEPTFDEKQDNKPTCFEDQAKATEASPTAGDSDDDYNRVDLISDSGEDEPSVEQVEERNIIESEEADDLNTAPASLEASGGREGFGLDGGLLFEDDPFFDEQYGLVDPNNLNSEMELFKSTSMFDDVTSPSPPSPSPRRVHFKEPILQSLNDSDIDSDNGDINVLFTPNDTPIEPSGGGLDLGGPHPDLEGDDGSSVGRSSGYETDYGDTTDEEDVPASAVKRPQSLLRRPSLSALERGAQIPATPTVKGSSRYHFNTAGYRCGPRLGTWTVDSTRPCAVIDSTGENMIIRPATRSSKPKNTSMAIANSTTSTANASRVVSRQTPMIASEKNGNDLSGLSIQAPMYEYNDPVLGPGSDMVAASAPPPPDHRLQNSIGHSFTAPSVFLPMDAMGDVSSYFGDDYLNDNDNDDDDDDDDAFLDINAFIDFGDDSSEDGEEAAGDESTLTSPVMAEDPSPVQLKTPSPDATMTSTNLMKHLDKHIVSAFRRGQTHHQPQSRLRHGNLALNGYALKGGRQASANAQVVPQKKRKMSGSHSHRPSIGVSTAKKRMVHHR